MITKWVILFALTIFMVKSVESQVVYERVEKGEKKQIQEQNFIIELEETVPILEKIINDVDNKQRFRLISKLQKDEKGQYAYCSVMLYRKKKDLLNYNIEELGDYITGACCLGYFEPTRDKTIMGEDVDDSFSIPLSVKRVIKVGKFYCILQVKDYSFIPDKKGVLKSIKINVEFTNSYNGERTSYSQWKRNYLNSK